MDLLKPGVINIDRQTSRDTWATEATYNNEKAEGKFSIVAHFVNADVDISRKRTALALFWYCFNAGFLAAVGFAATSLWIPFQSGNTVQLGLAIGQAIVPSEENGPNYFHLTDQQALTSLLSFALGGLFIQLVPTRWRKKRAMQVYSCALQVIMTAIAAGLIHMGKQPTFSTSRLRPSWTNAYGFVAIGLLSASSGIQGVASDALTSPVGVSVVLTSLWVQVCMQPLSIWRAHRTRDHKAIAIVTMLFGAIIGRCIVGKTNSAVAIGILAGFRFCLLLLWTMTPVKAIEKDTQQV